MVDESDSEGKYEIDEDGLPREIVGPWVKDKHARLEKYVGISRSVRAMFSRPGGAGASFIDLFSGPGRVRIRDEQESRDGGALVAWHEAVNGGARFTQVHVADVNPAFADAVELRLIRDGAPALKQVGEAADVVDAVVKKLNRYALHFAFLDPYALKALPFDIIRKLASLQRMDILVHVSIQDLQRNLRRYIGQEGSPLDSFAPGWRQHVDVSRSDDLVRAKFLEHWRNLLKAEGMSTTETAELVVGTKNQRLYLLAFAARHDRALEFWEKIRHLDGNQQGTLL
ncbi:MAG: three-Cys-motif partner protein TcmP [Parvibaculum sp.]|uniref:three-Cys-motif partner protein TcmP n=1 Tax=Parvibaculum sp. TaxID=2024848 RepID=UPI002721A8CA|nr:three-Cys-motif partner protein TcmP [Parvibaculum sp.]MDO8837963.1 three-Cys-motif partner protein TcmP [Parvibaculum sp.]